MIEQGSLIDRIDFNIEETLLHAEKANEHLEKVDKNVRNSCAQKCTLALIAIILVLAVVIGFKLSNKTA